MWPMKPRTPRAPEPGPEPQSDGARVGVTLPDEVWKGAAVMLCNNGAFCIFDEPLRHWWSRSKQWWVPERQADGHSPLSTGVFLRRREAEEELARQRRARLSK